eukprot:Gb_23116 [translate_table: standard]
MSEPENTGIGDKTSTTPSPTSSMLEERAAAVLLMSKMVETLKGQPVQARIFEGKEPAQFFSTFQNLVVFKGGLSSGYKRHIEEKGIADDTYKEDDVALFRVQGTGPENMQAIQVEPAVDMDMYEKSVGHKEDGLRFDSIIFSNVLIKFGDAFFSIIAKMLQHYATVS